MPTPRSEGVIETGLFDPVTANVTGVDDHTLLTCLVTTEAALTRAWVDLGLAPSTVGEACGEAFGWQGPGQLCTRPLDAGGFDVVTGGNPVIPLIPKMREKVPPEACEWVHKGATSQDIMDSALMLLSRITGTRILEVVDGFLDALNALGHRHRNTVTVARTLTQHGVPTTWGARIAGWGHGIKRARQRLHQAIDQLPAQLAGAGGTSASFVEIAGAKRASGLPRLFATQLGLQPPSHPWHTVRWPVTELGDALAQVVGALGTFASDVATLARTEIQELTDTGGGGSSAMPQKNNPTRAVLIKSAAIRTPLLSASLHTSAALAVDERPDGAWHAEWPVLRDLLKITLGAATLARDLVADLQIDEKAVARNVELSGGLILAERVSLVLGPLIGSQKVKELLARAGEYNLTEVLMGDPQVHNTGIDIPALLDPHNYVGLAPGFDSDEESHD